MLRGKEELFKKTIKLFIIIFPCLSLILGGMLFSFYYSSVHDSEMSLLEKEQYYINHERDLSREHFSTVVSDLLFLADQGSSNNCYAPSSTKDLDYLKRGILAFSAQKKRYDQIRYIDAQGNEILRVNYNNGNPVLINPEKLQNKLSRYYFAESFKLAKNEVYISPFDLNVEYGAIEVPYKPMLRFGTPVFDDSGTKEGIVLLNYLGEDYLKLIKSMSLIAYGDIMLLNQDGYFLSHPDSEREWGFMINPNDKQCFLPQHLDLWQKMQTSSSGQIKTDDGVYTFTKLSPLNAAVGAATTFSERMAASERMETDTEYFWILMSFIPAEKLAAIKSPLLWQILWLGGGVLIIIMVGSWFLAQSMTRRKFYQEKLFAMAHYDLLTGLPNRALLFEHLQQVLYRCQRYQRKAAVMYMDLDGFKAVNDTLGHDAGDDLLVAVGERIKAKCRASDTVARLGGDEFAVLLPEIQDISGVQLLAEKILKTFQDPFILKKSEAHIGVSIGISIYPENGTSLEGLLDAADKAMYSSKNKGKNTLTFAVD
ncbi:diguanylate cyclase (GGDEF) domain-containing protein [Desulfuromusa kysingii]|uniref:Diguanylate cyclase (GGDEF) domain-containing protein n=1 Tax=Desulfuromusa kysingii TaxID=37625 RepID=A0A1H3W3I3_9BACT|nr:GGDEF domain-containing protein [Desulfuromusa kysingii]SDZ80974.1 diguanylate cyclase (GGDEF) domain-containing protein [Desulfuromusa kysingii]